ncbi:uncharacterized protein LOC124777341 [Schistocerca piceifrons]|uniref:uncharacterized protein LOC124777341 n=1 Tax=Schistocerca piceifrons TaxID=274613 RepID=UPI001F5F3193|nr:uncharacterized protein LOC124777341 [Schistocerca piceifrons]
MAPYVVLADEAFALHENVMKPYAGVYEKGTKEKTFNYRLSRARQVVENCFGILTSVFSVLRKPKLLGPEKASVIVLTTICLHNYLRQSKKSSTLYAPDGTVDRELPDGTLVEGTWRWEAQPISLCNLKSVPRKHSSNARAVREEMAGYFLFIYLFIRGTINIVWMSSDYNT